MRFENRRWIKQEWNCYLLEESFEYLVGEILVEGDYQDEEETECIWNDV